MRPANKCSRETSGWRTLRNGVVFLQGHDGEFTFMAKHGLLRGTSEAPRIFSLSFDWAFKHWKLDHQTAPSMMFRAPFAGMGAAPVERLCGRFIHQRRATAPHRRGRQIYHSEERSFARCYVGRELVHTESPQVEARVQHSPIRFQRCPFRQDPGQSQALRRPLRLQWD